VLTHGSGSSRSAGILAMCGFDTIGISQSIGLLQKEARIVREVTGTLGATEPASVVALAERTLDRLGGGS
jgi:hypothetical protein